MCARNEMLRDRTTNVFEDRGRREFRRPAEGRGGGRREETRLSCETEGDRSLLEPIKDQTAKAFANKTLTSKTWIRTWPSYHAFDLLNPDSRKVEIEDIAHHLSMLCRFTGGCRKFYSVAEHCVRVSRRCAELAGLPDKSRTPWDVNLRAERMIGAARAGLLHDSAEAYVNDLSRPAKYIPGMDSYRAVEKGIGRTISLKFGILFWDVGPFSEIVHRADNELLSTERAQLLRKRDREWDETVAVLYDPLPDVRIAGWSPEMAKKNFLKEFKALGPWDIAK